MSDHDPLCYQSHRAGGPSLGGPCECVVIRQARADERERMKNRFAKEFAEVQEQLAVVLNAEQMIRADERERIAAAIEGRAATHECGRAYRHAARIARGDAE